MRHHKKKRLNKNAVMALFIVLIMTSSILGFVWTNITTDNYTYKGHKFKLQGDSFTLTINGQKINTNYLPTEIEHIQVSEEVKTKIKGAPMFYLSFNPESENIEYIDRTRFELTNEIQKTNIYAISGKTINSTSYNLPIITCENATAYVPVILLKDSNTTEFSLKDDCIIAESSSKEGFIALKDIIIYTIFNII